MNDELMLERFMLMKERVLEIQEEELVKDPYRDFFRRTAAFITQMLQVYDKLQAGWLDTASLEELEANNQAMYQDILPQNYEKSYGNPSYAQAMLGEEMGQLLSFLYTEIRGMIVFVYENRLFDMTVAMELFIQIYNLFEEETVSAKDVQDAIYWYVSDYSDEMVGHRVREGVDPELNFATNIICGNNLADVRYLYNLYNSISLLSASVFRKTLVKRESGVSPERSGHCIW